MNLKNVNEALDHKITGGSEYGWTCWTNARWLDYESEYAYASVVFNAMTQEVYTAEVNDKANNHKPYRWLNPEHKEAMYQEARTLRIEANQAWDNTMWYDLDVEEDWLEKARAIMRGEDFDTRVQIPLNLEKEELFKLMELAHKNDVTLNKMVEIILQDMIDKNKS